MIGVPQGGQLLVAMPHDSAKDITWGPTPPGYIALAITTASSASSRRGAPALLSRRRLPRAPLSFGRGEAEPLQSPPGATGPLPASQTVTGETEEYPLIRRVDDTRYVSPSTVLAQGARTLGVS